LLAESAPVYDKICYDTNVFITTKPSTPRKKYPRCDQQDESEKHVLPVTQAQPLKGRGGVEWSGVEFAARTALE